MSVILAKRNKSRFEPLRQAAELRLDLTNLLARNFGVKNLDHVVRLKYAYRKEPKEDLPKYIFLMSTCKRKVNEIATQIELNVRAANSIYPTSMEELTQRREYMNIALINCEQLLSELQYVSTLFDVDINDYRQYIERIDKEIKLIKQWRQSDNKIKRRLSN